MTNYREVLRLHSLGLNKTEIASSCQCARNTVAATLQRAANCGLQWPLPEEMSDKTLSERLFPSSASNSVYKTDYAYVHRDLQRSGVTLNLLWLEYCDRCRAAGEIPHQSPQFNKYYADYLAKANATMRLHDFGADASFCIFFAPVANCIFTVWVPPCEEKCRCPEGCNPFGSGFPIGARSTLLAHDFALQSLVCYTFCDR